MSPADPVLPSGVATRLRAGRAKAFVADDQAELLFANAGLKLLAAFAGGQPLTVAITLP
jgi:hypothetical protein